MPPNRAPLMSRRKTIRVGGMIRVKAEGSPAQRDLQDQQVPRDRQDPAERTEYKVQQDHRDRQDRLAGREGRRGRQDLQDLRAPQVLQVVPRVLKDLPEWGSTQFRLECCAGTMPPRPTRLPCVTLRAAWRSMARISGYRALAAVK